MEWSRFYFLCGFSWNLVGIALTSYALPMQMAALFGTLGLSFWVMLVNLLGLRSKTACLVCALVPYLFGFIHLNYHQSKIQRLQPQELSFALIQPGWLPPEKMPLYGYAYAFIPPLLQWHQIADFLKKIPKDKSVDIIVLPEVALSSGISSPLTTMDVAIELLDHKFGKEILHYLPPPTPPFIHKTLSFNEGVIQEKISITHAFIAQAIANYFNAEVVIGLEDYDTNKQQHYNAAFHFIPNKNNLSRYEKRVLVPLAEYLPFQWCRSLTKSYGIHEFYTPGKEAKVFCGKVPLALSICYEETFPNLIRESRLKGANLLVNVTNDGYFPFSKLAQQHYDHGRIRSVENGTPLIRACNTGVSAAIDSLGKTTAKLEKGSGLVLSSISLYHYKTLYTLLGDAGIISICLFFLILYLTLKKVFKI